MGMKVVYTRSELELDTEILLVAEGELKKPHFSRLIACFPMENVINVMIIL